MGHYCENLKRIGGGGGRGRWVGVRGREDPVGGLMDVNEELKLFCIQGGQIRAGLGESKDGVLGWSREVGGWLVARLGVGAMWGMGEVSQE